MYNPFKRKAAKAHVAKVVSALKAKPTPSVQPDPTVYGSYGFNNPVGPFKRY